MGDELLSGGGAPDPGQAAAADPSDFEGQTAEPFFSYTGDDGKELAFATKDDLTKGFGQSFMRHADYTRKTQEHSNAVKEWEENRKKQEEEFTAKQEEFKKFDNMVRTRPDVMKYLRQQLSKAPGADVQSEVIKKLLEEQMTPVKQELEGMKQQRQREQLLNERKTIYADMKTAYPDFDEKTIGELMNTFNANDHKSLVELFYYYNKGKANPAKQAELQAINRTKKIEGGMPPSSSGKRTPGTAGQANTIEEAREAALKSEIL